MAGRAILRKLRQCGQGNIITRSRAMLDLTNQRDVMDFFKSENIDQVYICAAKVGGIKANHDFPAAFIYENLMIEANIIHGAHLADIEKIMFLGSSCIYPANIAQPIRESALLTGTLEPTNEAYAIAKIAGIKLCESYNRQYGRDYRCIMPTNLYGSHDNYHLENAHVIPALLHRFHRAVQENADTIDIWGSGNALREFLYVDDMAAACVHLMELPRDRFWPAVLPMVSHVNIGSGQDVSIKQLAEMIAKITGFSGVLRFDRSKPEGVARKLLDSSLANSLGWQPQTGLQEGLELAYAWFVENQAEFRN
ncbi:MAG: GDP-L-fucose synthase [Rhodobacteraceae bacterium]|nr:GDP-L-fucose synthase [Paracoccaceae bacterium]